MKSKRSMPRWSNYSPSSYRKLKKNEHALLRENRNNIERSDWKFWRVVEKFEVGIEKVNYDAVETSSKNLKVSQKNIRRDRRRTVVDRALTHSQSRLIQSVTDECWVVSGFP